MDALTDRQTEILAFITTYYRQHGYGPTLRELMDEFGITSMNGAKSHVDRLRHKGAIEPAPPNHARVIVPTRSGNVCPCCGQQKKGKP